MEIYVAVDDNPTGPYSVEEVQQLLATGQIRPENRAWREGMGEWEPLAKWFEPAKTAGGEVALPPPAAPAQATTALRIGLCSLAAWILLIVMAGVLGPGKGGEGNGVMVVLGLLMFATFGANLTGAVMGGLAVYKSGPRRDAVMGLALNLGLVLAIVGLFFVGSAKH